LEWKSIYKSRVVSAEEAVSHIRPGDRVIVALAAADPVPLIDALTANKENYNNVELLDMLPMGNVDYSKEGMEKYFIANSVFLSPPIREAAEKGRCRFTPTFLHQFPRVVREQYKPDVALLSCSRPDKHGFVSFGIDGSYSKPAAEYAKTVICEANDQMPRTGGTNFMHVSEIDWFVETSRPLLMNAETKVTEVEETIGRYCASLIEDGSTLQLGIGAIPDAVLHALKDKKDLGVHTEMLTEGIVELYEQGVITNKLKKVNTGKFVATFVVGSSKKLYDFIDDNPCVEMHSCDYINDPFIISQNPKVVAINAALAIDLTGQVNAESDGIRQISGVGGQVDFLRGAMRSEGGKSIIAFTSTSRTKKGILSKIVPVHPEGTIITSLRNDVHYVVTEYGIANLKGISTQDKAKQLIEIAHPDFRGQLVQYYEKVFHRLY